MNPSLHRALRPASRRVQLAARPILASTGAQARRQQQHSSTNRGGPIDPVADHEMQVGELEGAKFRIEPLRRVGEDAQTMRARLTCMSLFRCCFFFFFFFFLSSLCSLPTPGASFFLQSSVFCLLNPSRIPDVARRATWEHVQELEKEKMS